jgi:cytochrome bd ubiquinol oxidase subunit II
MTLPLISAGFAAFALTAYVVLDGFDLGVGALLFLERTQTSRDHMVDSITPTWDGNETWLIMAGVTLLAAFPIACGILLPALYLPVIIMLLALGLRGVSFEFRVQKKQKRHVWDLVFASGSVVAAFMQGIILGTLLNGIKTDGTRFDGTVLDVLQPFSLLCGVTLVTGYVVLGAGWLYLKANTRIQQFASRVLRVGSVCFATLFCVSCLYAKSVQPGVAVAWSSHRIALSLLAALFLILSGCLFALSGRKQRPILPFLAGIAQFIVGMAGIAVIIYPNIVPFRVSLWDAAASSASQVFILIGVAVVCPVVIAYSAFAYWVFRGRTPAGGWGE